MNLKDTRQKRERGSLIPEEERKVDKIKGFRVPERCKDAFT